MNRICRRMNVAMALIALAATSPIGSNAQGNNPGVVPVTATPYGASYGEWGSRWWQWAYSIPVSSNPLFDETGAFAANGQPFKQVYFLAGVYNSTGQAE